MANTKSAPLRKPYSSEVGDEEWAFVAPYLALVRADAPLRHHDLREVFNAARWVVPTDAPRRWLPHDLPPGDIVYTRACRNRKFPSAEEVTRLHVLPALG